MFAGSYSYTASTKALSQLQELSELLQNLQNHINSSHFDTSKQEKIWNDAWWFQRDFRKKQSEDPNYGLNGEPQMWIDQVNVAIATLDVE